VRLGLTSDEAFPVGFVFNSATQNRDLEGRSREPWFDSRRSYAKKRSHKDCVSGTPGGRDALRKRHGAAFLAKAGSNL